MFRRFIASARDWLLDNDELRLRSSGGAQLFQNRDAIIVRPVVQYQAEKVDRNFFLRFGLRFEEVLGLKNPMSGPISRK
jgi:hypothetical protein